MNKLFLFILLTIYSIPLLAETDIDTVKLQNFANEQMQHELEFIENLKLNNIEECMKHFSPNVLKMYGIDSLKNILIQINELFLNFPDYEINSFIGIASNGVGSIGRDVPGKFDRKTTYMFIDKENNIRNWFSLYYNDSKPVGQIVEFEAKFNLKPLNLFEPYKPPPHKGE